jgi:hypothetical protein
MVGSEYRQQIAKHGTMDKSLKKAVTSVYDKKATSSDYDSHPEVKKAKRYMKIGEAVEKMNESNSSMDRMADTWNDHADHKHPTVQKHIKKAKKAYDGGDHEGFHNHTQMAADAAYKVRKEEMDKLDEISNELVKKVAHKRAVNTSMELSKAHGDRRDPNYQDAAKKQDRNQKLRFARGAKAIGKMRNESARDNYDPEISDKRTKEKLKKAGLPPESPKVMETILRDVFEGKKKGMDGKACWKGYKLQGTKKKGNRTVDNCVPMSEQEEVKPHKMFKGDKVVMAKNTAEHEKLKKQGYTHDDP